ncbi:hypothetical protein A9Q76_09970 [Arcobacter sp. 31_11_sub10_T18]|nr:hypothetical protein A9Q76_09970 [Arcobacter sp. 31_11_sub10_T18]
MKFINEENISRSIIYIFIIIMSIMIILISYIYVKNRHSQFDLEMKNFITQHQSQQRALLRKEINIVIDILKYNETKINNEEELKKEAIKLIHNISFRKNKSDYFFVYKIYDFHGGDKFAKLIVNRNRPDLIGEFISTNYTDAKGKKFKKEFLININKTGESYTDYFYINPVNNKVEKKLSYFKLYPKWNWVIATGIYLNDIEAVLEQKKKHMKDAVRLDIIQTILLYILFLTLAIIVSYSISSKIEKYFKKYKARLKNEVDKNNQKDKILFQQSKSAALGELLGIIAHQWRHPLANINSNTLLMVSKSMQNKNLSSNEIIKIVNEIETSTEFLSKTICEFTQFYSPDKKENKFHLLSTINDCINIIFPSKSYQIDININEIDNHVSTIGFKSLYQQVIVTILVNAIQQFEIRNIENPKITIEICKHKDMSEVTITDNALGIDENILSDIFKPYVSSKKTNVSMGFGLYIAHNIIVQHKNASIQASNVSNGARFTIIF